MYNIQPATHNHTTTQPTTHKYNIPHNTQQQTINGENVKTIQQRRSFQLRIYVQQLFAPKDHQEHPLRAFTDRFSFTWQDCHMHRRRELLALPFMDQNRAEIPFLR